MRIFFSKLFFFVFLVFLNSNNLPVNIINNIKDLFCKKLHGRYKVFKQINNITQHK